MKNLLAVFTIVGILFLVFSFNTNAITNSSVADEIVLKVDDTIISNTNCTHSKTECEMKCASTDTTKSCCKKDATKCESSEKKCSTEGTKCKAAKKAKCEKKCNSDKGE
jgi:hypothetical protein